MRKVFFLTNPAGQHGNIFLLQFRDVDRNLCACHGRTRQKYSSPPSSVCLFFVFSDIARGGRKQAFRAVRKRQIFPDLVVNANHPAASSFSPYLYVLSVFLRWTMEVKISRGGKKRKIWPSSVGFVVGRGDLYTIFECSAGLPPSSPLPPFGHRTHRA